MRFSADSLLVYLKSAKPDSLDIMLGLTAADIFTTKKNPDGTIRHPTYKYAVWGIFGLGHCPGSACVISSYRLKSNGSGKTRKRLRNVVLHELGHNLGLPHCIHTSCIMTDANEDIRTIDNSSQLLCESCRNKWKEKGL